MDFSHCLEYRDEENFTILSAIAVGHGRMKEFRNDLVVASRYRADTTRIEQQKHRIPSRFYQISVAARSGNGPSKSPQRKSRDFGMNWQSPPAQKHLERQYRLDDLFILLRRADEQIVISGYLHRKLVLADF